MAKRKTERGKRKQATKARKVKCRKQTEKKVVGFIPRLTYFDKDLAREVAFIILSFFVIGLGMFIVKPSITGFIIAEGSESVQIDELNLVVNETSKVLWQPKGNDIRSLRATGAVIGDGQIRIYLERGNLRYLIYDNKDEGSVLITGQVISDAAQVLDAGNEDESGNESEQTNIDENEGKPEEDSDDTSKIPKEASVEARLEYSSSANFDIDNDGLETLTGVVDFNVIAGFNWDVDYNKLCSKWRVTSLDTFESTSVCYGNNECCAQFGLLALFDAWNESFSVYYNRYGATNNNLVYAQVFYYGKKNNDFVSSNASLLKAEFRENAKEFSERCIETCSLFGFTEQSYNLSFEIENAALRLDKLVYSVFEKIENQRPILVKNISDVNAFKNEIFRLNLSQYFNDHDNDVLGYSHFKSEHFNVSYDNNIAIISFATDFIGVLNTFFTASDGEASVVSNVFSINVTESIDRPILLEPVRVGKPVKWKKKVPVIDNIVQVNITASAINVSVKKVDIDTGKIEEVNESQAFVRVKNEVKNLEQFNLERAKEKLVKEGKTEEADKIEEKLQEIVTGNAAGITGAVVAKDSYSPGKSISENSGLLSKSNVETTGTLFCFFNAASLDHNGSFNFNASAKKSTSLGSGEIFNADGKNSLYSSTGINATAIPKSDLNFLNSSSDIPVFFKISDVCALTSSSANSGENSSRSILIRNLLANELFQKNVYNMLVSTTSSTYISPFPFNASSLPLLEARCNLTAQSVISCSLSNSLRNSSSLTNFFAFSSIDFLTNPDQFISGNSSISLFISDETDTVIDTILNASKSVKKQENVKIFKSFGSNSAESMITGAAIVEQNIEAESGFVEEGIIENATVTVDIEPEFEEVIVEYETDAPEAVERNISEFSKQIVISSEIPYTNVIASSELAFEVPKDAIKVEWLTANGREEITQVDYYDNNENGLVDYIEWIVPHLSEQTFEITITVLNVQSFPTVGGNWEVRFNTTGNGNLSIYAFNGTTYSEFFIDDGNTTNDLTPIELKCGDNIKFSRSEQSQGLDVSFLLVNGSKVKLIDAVSSSLPLYGIFVENYSCDTVGSWTVTVLTLGIHNQMFNFSGQLAEAHNLASIAGNRTAQNQFIDDSDTDFNKGTFSNTNVSGTGGAANITLSNFSSLYVNLTAYWKLDEASGTRADSIGGNDLQDPGNNVTSWFGKIGNATNFTRANGAHLNITDNAALSTGDINFTISAWVYIEGKVTGTQNEYIVARDNQTGASEYILYFSGGATDRFRFAIYDGTRQNTTTANSLGSPAIDRWYFIVGWHDAANDQIGIQVDNGTADTVTTGFALVDNTSALTIGSDSNTPIGNIMNGSIDEVGFWKRVLTQDERTYLYNKGRGVSLPFYNTTGNFTSQYFDANRSVNFNSIYWTQKERYGMEFQSDEVNSSIVLLMHFNNDTGEYERELNVTYNLSLNSSTHQPNLVLYMPFSSSNAREITPNASTVLLMHFNNDSLAENASFFRSNATYSNNGTCDITLGKCPSINLTDMKLGRAGITFNGSQYINMSNVSLANYSAFTVEAWIKTSSITTNRMVVYGEVKGDGVGNYFSIGAGTTDLTNGELAIEVANTVGQQFIGSSVRVTDGLWHHIAATVGNKNVSLYLDGSLVNFSGWNHQPNTPNTWALIGTRTDTDGRVLTTQYYNGSIDELAIWNISLSSGEIAKHAGYGIDLSMYGNNASFMNGSRVNTTNFKFGEAMQFDGVGDHINITSASRLNFSNGLTIETWIYPAGSPADWEGILYKSNGTGVEFALRRNNAADSNKIAFILNNGGVGSIESGARVNQNEWTHVAATYNNSIMKIYINGIESNLSSYTSPIGSGAGNIVISHLDNLRFNGTIDEVAVWNTSLGSDAIAEHAGVKVRDYSNYGNNGTRRGNVTFNASDAKFGRAMYFDGIDDFVNVTRNSVYDFTNEIYTIEIWARPLASSDTMWLIDKDANSAGYGLGITSGGAIIHRQAGGSTVQTSAGIVRRDEWAHFVASSDGTNAYIYLDGVQMGSAAKADITDASTTLKIGDHTSNPNFNGTIDEVVLWNISLDNAAIRRHYERGANRLNVSYRTSSDNITWSAWNYTGNSTLTNLGFSITDDSLVTVVDAVVVENERLNYLENLNSDKLGIGDMSKSSSSKVIRYPSKSSGLDLDLSNLENDSKSASGLSCGILNQITENIFSLGNKNESVKSSSFVTNINSSDLESAANVPLENPFGLKVTSHPSDFKNFNNSFFTFSSSRNVSFLEGNCDFDIIPSSGEISSIVQGCLDMLLCERCYEACNYLFNRHACLKHLKDLPDHDSCAIERGLAVADFTVSNNEFVDFDSHDTNKEGVIFKDYGNNTSITISISEFKEICPSLDCNVIDYITSKKKIKDIKEGDYVLSWDEKANALKPRKVIELLDHGIKSIVELKTISGKAINTTPEHPYLAKLYDKELCDKYSDTYWNRNDSGNLHEFDGKYCTRWVEASELQGGTEIAVSGVQSSPVSNFSTNSLVVSTLTNDCCLRCGSLDQIVALIDTASARKSASSGSGSAFADISRKSLYSDSLKNLIPFSSSACLISNSCSDNFEYDKHLLLCSANSDFMKSGAEKSAFMDENTYAAPDIGFIKENNILLSNTSFMFYSSAFLLFSGESLESNSSLFSGESSASSLLNLPFFAFLPSSTDHLISSCSFFDSSFCLHSSSSAFCNKFSRATSDQFTQGNFSILDFSDSSTANVMLAIYSAPFCLSSSNFSSSSTFLMMPLRTTSAQFISGLDFLNFSSKSSGIDTVIFGILIPPSIYFNTSKNVRIFKSFDSGIVFEKIASITPLKEQHVYDLAIEGTRNFIANDIIAHNTNRYFQYRLEMNTSDAAYSPVFNNITINFTIVSNLTIKDTSEDTAAIVTKAVNFTANYTDGVNAITGNEINCSFSRNDSGAWSAGVNMSYSSGLGIYYYSITFANKTSGYFNVTCDGRASNYPVISTVDFFNVTNAAFRNFGGNTTNFDELNATNISNAVLENVTYGKIVWINNISANGADFDTQVAIRYNYVIVNSSSLGRSINSSANITLYNINATSPRIFKDGSECTTCSILSYNPGFNITFNTTSFSNHTVVNGTVNVTVNLSATSVSPNTSLFVYGHVNLSNGTNLSNQRIFIFVNGTSLDKNNSFLDDNNTDFNKGNTSLNVTISGSGGAANITLNRSISELVANSSTLFLFHFNNETTAGENASFFRDNSSYQNNGTCDLALSKCPVFNESNARLGKAGLKFDGVNDFVNISYNPMFDMNGLGDFTLEAWIKTTNTSTQRIIAKANSGNEFGAKLGTINSPAGAAQVVTSSTASSITTSVKTVNDGDWHHIVGIRRSSGTIQEIYIDGELDVSETVTARNISGNVQIAIGAESAPSTLFFSGTIDEVAVWNISLPPSEIARRAGYVPQGNFTSQVFDAGGNANWTAIYWTNTSTLIGVNITFQARTSLDNITWPSLTGPDNTSNTYYTLNNFSALNVSSGRYFQYRAYLASNFTNATPVLNNVTVNYTGFFTDSAGNYNVTFTAPSTIGTHPVVVNTTYSTTPGPLVGTATQNLRVIQAPTLNANFTVPTNPRFNNVFSLQANVTDADSNIKFVNFTVYAPNGTNLSLGNATRPSGDLYNSTGINITDYGIWRWNLSIVDDDNFGINSSGSFQLLEILLSLNATVVVPSTQVKVTGHVNLSNGTNLTNTRIFVFVNGTALNGTQNASFVDKNVTDFDKGTYNQTFSITNNITIIKNNSQATRLFNSTQFSANSSTILFLQFNDGSGQTAVDSSQYGNNGTLGNSSSADTQDPTWNSTSKFGASALTFDGIDDFVNVSNSSIFNIAGDMTIEAWIKTPSVGPGGGILTKMDNGQNFGYGLTIRNAGVVDFLVRNNSATGSSACNPSGNTIVTDNKWHHVAGIRKKGTSCTIFVDGLVDKNVTTGGEDGLNNNSLPILIGCTFDSRRAVCVNDVSNERFNGSLDEVALWNISLDNATIYNHYLLGLGYNTSGNFTSQVFDAGAGGNVTFNTLYWSQYNKYGMEFQSDEVNSSIVLLMHFNNDTGEYERELNATYNLSLNSSTHQPNLVLYMPFSSSNAREIVPNASTVLLLHFNNDSAMGENASFFRDNSTYQNNGTCSIELNTCPAVNLTDVKLGRAAMTFDSVDDFINITDSNISSSPVNPGSKSFTISAWIKAEASPTHSIVVKRTSGIGYMVQIVSGVIRGTIEDSSGAIANTVDGQTVNDDQWHHVAVVFDRNSTMTRYVDGAITGTRDSITSLGGGTGVSNTLHLLIGKHHSGASTPFNGTMDEVAIWNISLSSGEIAKHAGYGIDLSMYGNNATEMNATRVNQTGCKFGECMYFDGLNARINTSYVNNPKISAFTLEAWVKPDAVDSGKTRYILGNRMTDTETSSREASLRMADVFDFVTDGGGGLTGGPAISTNQWYHVAGIWSGVSKGLYVNGVLVANRTLTGYFNNFTKYTIGFPTDIAGGFFVFNGTIDEVAIWNITLNNDTIAEHAGVKVRDYSNYGNNGTRMPNATAVLPSMNASGMFGKAMVFDGVNDFVKASSSNSLKNITGNGTIILWINPAGSLANSPIIIEKATGNACSTGTYIGLINTDGTQQWCIGDTVGGNVLTTKGTITTAVWSHLAFIWDGSNLKAYINGVFDNSLAQTITPQGNDEPVIIGRLDTQATGLFNGTIDEVAVWNISLDATTIRRHYERGVLRLNVSYRTSSDNTTWGAWIYATNSTKEVITVNNTARYFQYRLELNTSDPAYSPIFNNITINYSGIFTDANADYNVTFTASSNIGTIPIKVNLTYNELRGERDTTLTMEANVGPNEPILNYPPAGPYISVNYVQLNFTPSDNSTITGQTQTCYVYADNKSASAFGLVNVSNGLSNGTITSFNWTNLNQTTYFWTVHCSDGSLNGTNATTRNFTIDTLKPSIDYSTGTEANATAFNRNWIFVNVSVSDFYFNNISFYLYNGSGVLLNQTNYTGSQNFTNFTTLTDGNYLYNVTVYDRANNQNTTAVRNITLDSRTPRVDLIYPTPSNNSRQTNNSVVINASVNDTIGTIRNCLIEIDNGTAAANFSMTISASSDYCNYTLASKDGITYILRVYGNDTVGNLNSSVLRYFRENIAPNNTRILAPGNNTRQTGNNLQLNYSTTDFDNDTITYFIFVNTNTSDPYTLFQSTESASFTYTPTDGTTYYWKVLATDTYENNTINATVFRFRENDEPSIPTVIRPNSSLTFRGGNNELINWTNSTDTDNDTVNITIFYSTDSGVTFPNVVVAVTINNGSFIWSVPSINTVNARVRVMANDSYELTQDDSDVNFRIDSNAPTIALDSPPNGSTLNNITWINFTITDNIAGVGNVIWGNGSFNSTDFTGTYDINTSNFTTGTKVITIYANDSAGNIVERNYTFTFTATQDIFDWVTPFANQNVRGSIIINVTNLSTFPTTGGFSNFTYDTATQNFTMSQNGNYFNVTFDTTTVSDGQLRITVYGNNTAGTVVRTDRYITVDNTNPKISLGLLNDSWRNGSVTFIYTPDDANNITSCRLLINGSINSTNTSITNEVTNTFLINLSDNHYTWNVNCTDQAGNIGTNATSFRIKIDTVVPSIILDDPPNGTHFRENYSINFTINDTLSGVNNVSWSNNYTVKSFNFINSYDINTTGWAEGNITLIIYANDSAGNTRELRYDFVVDNSPPLLTWNTPYANQKVSGVVLVNLTATDVLSNVSAVLFSYNATNNFTMNVSELIRFYEWNTSLTIDGTYTMKVYGNDTSLPPNTRTVNRLVQVDNTKPTIRLITPGNNTYSTNATVIFNYETNDLNEITNCSLFINGSVNASSTSISQGMTQSFNTTLAELSYRWTLNCSDESGNTGTNSSEFLITIDTTTPTIVYAGGTENNATIFSRNWIFVNVTITDLNFNNVSFYLYYANGTLVNQTNYTGSQNFTNFTSLADSGYFYNVTTYDKAGNNASVATRNITLDTKTPSVVYEAATAGNASFVNRNWVFVNVTVTEANLANITFALYYGNLSLINETNYTTLTTFINFTGLTDNGYLYNVTVRDTVNNQNTTGVRNITIDTLVPTIDYAGGTEINASAFNRNWIFVNVSVTDLNFNNVSFYLYNGSNGAILNQTNYTGSQNFTNFTTLADGSYLYNVTVYDKANNVNYTVTRNITLDSRTPSIDYAGATEANATAFNRNWIFINVSITETNFNNVTFAIYNGSSGAVINETNFTTLTNNINFTALSDNNYLYNVTVRDKASNINYTVTRNITLDTRTPSINYSGGTSANASTVDRSWVFINVSITEVNLANISFALYYNNLSVLNETNFTTLVTSTNFTSLSDATYRYNVTARDTANNQNVTELRTITIDTSVPAPVGGGGGGGGAGEGGGGIAPVKKKVVLTKFSVSRSDIKVNLGFERSVSESITVTNQGEEKVAFSVAENGLDTVLTLPVTSFELAPGQSFTVPLYFFGKELGVFVGSIIISANGIEKSVSVIVEVESQEILFDVKMDVASTDTILDKGENVKAQITLLNIVRKEADVIVAYFVKDITGKSVYERSETFAVKDQTSYPVEFQTKYLKSGDYVLGIEVRYGKSFASSTQLIKIEEPAELAPEQMIAAKTRIGLLLLLSTILAAFSLAAFMLRDRYVR